MDTIISWWFIGYVAISIIFTILALGESVWREIKLRRYSLGKHKPFWKDWVELLLIFSLLPGINIVIIIITIIYRTATWLFPEEKKY